MRHRMAGRKLGRPTEQRNALLRGMVTEFLRHEKMDTTQPKAQEARRQAEKIITLGKQGDLHARRQALAYIYDPAVVDKVFHVLAPRFSARPGGYTRLIKLGFRLGDGAPMARLELVE